RARHTGPATPGQVRCARAAAGLTDRRAQAQQGGGSNEDASCRRHSCDGDRSPRPGEDEAGAIRAPPARLSVVGATRLLPRLPSEGLVPRLVIELLIFGVEKHRWAFALPILCGRRGLCRAASNRLKPPASRSLG